ncbi:MAG: DUF2064 domain-containing protein [Chlorobi bacterium]|nr:DUF2064 domain-containing protein [Chlorobiota bacterium]
MTSRRAILFFVRDEGQEQQIKPLPQVCGSLQSYRTVNRAICARLSPLLDSTDLVLATTGNQTQLKAKHVLPQHGKDFGERIANAVDDVLSLGYEQVVVIGNDCPSIRPDDILSAFNALECGAGAAAAPTRDGGAFLIGLQRDYFNRELFAGLSWQTSTLFNQLCTHLSATALAITRSDFDSWQSHTAKAALIELLELALYSPVTEEVISFDIIPTRRKELTRLFLPAPPLFA